MWCVGGFRRRGESITRGGLCAYTWDAANHLTSGNGYYLDLQRNLRASDSSLIAARVSPILESQMRRIAQRVDGKRVIRLRRGCIHLPFDPDHFLTESTGLYCLDRMAGSVKRM